MRLLFDVVVLVIALVLFKLLIDQIVKCELLQKQNSKLEKQLHTALRWIDNKNNDFSIKEWCKTNGYTKIAVYGYGYLGNRLVEEIKKNGMDLICIIDNGKKGNKVGSIPLCTSKDKQNADCIIVTVIDQFDNIEIELKSWECDIVSLDDVIFSF